MRLIRTYPQPDSPDLHIGPRERALAVFKYLLDMEPEVAKDHPLFACIEHAFVQVQIATRNDLVDRWENIEKGYDHPGDLQEKPSLVPMLTSERTIEPDARRFVADEGKL